MEVSKTSQRTATIFLILSVLLIVVSAYAAQRSLSIPQHDPVSAPPPTTPTAQVSISHNVTDHSIQSGTQLNFTVTIANSPPLNGFNVYVSFDPRVLTASNTSIDSKGNILQSVTSSIFTQSECITGQAAPGGACTNPQLDGPGVVNLGIVFLGNFSTPNNTSGLLYSLTLTVNDPSLEPLDPGATQLHLAQVILSPADITQPRVPFVIHDSFFTNRYCSGAILCSPPRAEFKYSPSTVSIGTNVLFNASTSFATNPGSSISSYEWSWDGEICRATPSLQIEQVPTVTHQFCNARHYSVSLIVNDTYGITWTSTQDIRVLYLWIDVYIRQFSISPQFNVVVGTPVSMTTVVGNNSTISENASLTISVENRTLATTRFVNLPPLSDSSPQQTIWNTAGLLAGTYTLEASLGPIPEANLTIATKRTANVYLVSTFDKPPTADFTSSPTSPVAGEQFNPGPGALVMAILSSMVPYLTTRTMSRATTLSLSQ